MSAPVSGGRRPRVALVALSIQDRDAVPRILAQLVRNLSGDVDFVVVSNALAPDLRPLVEWSRIPAAGRSLRLRQLTFALYAASRLRGIRAELVHTTLVILPNRTDLAWVQHCYSAFAERFDALEQPETRSARRFARALPGRVERWVYRRRVRVLASPSEGGARDLCRLFPGPRVAVAPNGVDLARFRPDPRAREELRRERGIGQNEVVALFVGAFPRGPRGMLKGLAVAIDGFALARRSTETALRLWILGGGDVAHYREVARGAGVARHTEFLGYVEDGERYYQAADVFVLPTGYETFCLAAHEAAACGLPLVATAANGIEQLIGDGEGGIVVRPDPHDVGVALARLADDPQLRAALGRAGRERARECTWERSAEAILRLYRDLLAGAPA